MREGWLSRSILWFVISAFVIFVVFIGINGAMKNSQITNLRAQLIVMEADLISAIRSQNQSAYQTHAKKITDTIGEAEVQIGLIQVVYGTTEYGDLLRLSFQGSYAFEQIQRIESPLGVWLFSYNFISPNDFFLGLRIILFFLLVWILATAYFYVTSPGSGGKNKEIHNVGSDVLGDQSRIDDVPSKGDSVPEPQSDHVPHESDHGITYFKNQIAPVQHTNGGKEAFLHRLERELQRAGEHAIDASIILLQGSSKQRPEEAIHQIIQEFIHDDLVFALGGGLFSVILPHHDIEQTMARAELFIRRVSQTSDTGVYPFCGAASRSGRILEAKTMYQEARAALQKAKSGKARIVGFKADPSRYRNYLLHQVV